MRFQFFVNSLTASVLFGMWQHSVGAGCFMFALLGLVLSIVEYFKPPVTE